LNKLILAKKFFETHTEIKSSSSVLTTIKSLIKTALTSCETVFEKLMKTCTSSVEIIDGTYNIINPLPANTVSDIKLICNNLELNQHRTHLETYQRLRIIQIKSDLNKFESNHSEEWANAHKDVPYQKGSHPFKDYCNYSFEVLRGELQLWGSLLPSNSETIQVYVNICEATLITIRQVISDFLIDKKSKEVNKNTALKQINKFLIQLDILDIFMSKYEELRDLCRLDNSSENKSSKEVNNIRNSLIESISHSISILFEITSDVNQIINTNVIHSKEKSTDIDDSCDLYPITGNILHCCKEITNFVSIYKLMTDIALEIEVNISTQAKLLSDFIFTLLNNLYNCLQMKAELFDRGLPKLTTNRLLDVKSHALYDHNNKDSDNIILYARKYLFLSNNLFSLLTYLRDKQRELQLNIDSNNKSNNTSSNNRKITSSLGSNVLTSLPYFKQIVALADAIEETLDKSQRDFSDIILLVLGLDAHSLSDFNTQHSKDKSGKYRVLKSKFVMFNSGIESLQSKQGEWRIPSSQLREKITQLLVDKIVSTYAEFYNIYSVIKFSKKHLSMYLKHSPADVDRLLKSFFGKNPSY